MVDDMHGLISHSLSLVIGIAVDDSGRGHFYFVNKDDCHISITMTFYHARFPLFI